MTKTTILGNNINSWQIVISLTTPLFFRISTRK